MAVDGVRKGKGVIGVKLFDAPNASLRQGHLLVSFPPYKIFDPPLSDYARKACRRKIRASSPVPTTKEREKTFEGEPQRRALPPLRPRFAQAGLVAHGLLAEALDRLRGGRGQGELRRLDEGRQEGQGDAR